MASWGSVVTRYCPVPYSFSPPSMVDRLLRPLLPPIENPVVPKPVNRVLASRRLGVGHAGQRIHLRGNTVADVGELLDLELVDGVRLLGLLGLDQRNRIR